jgi:putative NADH-flavin reductase
MKLVVFGASGGTGRAAVAAAARRGDEVTAFVRAPDRLGPDRSRVRVVEGDAFDAAAVARAIEGQDAVLSALGTRPWRHTDVCSQGVRHMVDAMRAQGVRRLVVVSALGAAESAAQVSWLARAAASLVLRRAFEDKARMEEIVRGSDLDWVIVRPAMLTSGRARGRWRVEVDGSIRGGFIPRADVAAFCLMQLTSDEYLGQAPALA